MTCKTTDAINTERLYAVVKLALSELEFHNKN